MSRDRAKYHHGNLRQAILDRAIELLRAEGTDGLGLRRIARDLGVSHAAPARHFANKGALLSAVIEDGYLRLMTTMQAAGAAGPGDAVGQIRAMMLAYVQWAAENPAHHGAMRNPEVIRHATPALREMLQRVRDAQLARITAAQATGWKAEQDPRTVMFQIVSVLAGTSMVLADPLYREVFGDMPVEALMAPMLDAMVGATPDEPGG